LFGYLGRAYNIFGIFVTNNLFTYFLNELTVKIDWFKNYSLPMNIVLLIDLYLIFFLYERNRFKNKFIYIPVFIMLFIVILCLGIDLIINYNLKNEIGIGWSGVVAGAGLGVIVIMLGIYHNIPEKLKKELSKRFHV